MLNNNLKNVFALIPEDGYVTAEQMASKLKISPKTVRKRIKELSDELKKFGVSIESKPRYGYTMVGMSKEELEELFGEAIEEIESIPGNMEERVGYLLLYLLNHKEFIKLDDLSEFLYISKTTLSSSIKQTEVILNRYGINLERRPNYGMRATGNEFDYRRCIVDNIVKQNVFEETNNKRQDKVLKELAEFVIDWTKKYHIKISEVAFENLVEHIYIMLRRVRSGRIVEYLPMVKESMSENDWENIQVLGDTIGTYAQIELPQEEYIYIAIHIMGKQIVGMGDRGRTNFVIREQIDWLVLQMLDLVYEDFKVDLRSNFDLRLSLNQHMVPLDIRLKYNIALKNPVLEKIKSEYSFAYTMGAHAANVLRNYYQKEISEDEIGYLALIFALVLEQREKRAEKSSILIVCSSGKGSSRLLMFKYRQEFGSYIDQIYVTDLLDLENFDFSKVNYIFTTVPITIPVPLPVFEIGLFLEKSDIVAVREILEKGNTDYLNDYYKENLFFSRVKGKNKEEILRQMCDLLKTSRELPENFYDAIMEREILGATDFGNLVAIPHPLHMVLEDTFVCVAILEKPILWSSNMVQVVFLTYVSEKKDENLQKFYQATTSLMLNEADIRELIEYPGFETLMKLLRKQK